MKFQKRAKAQFLIVLGGLLLSFGLSAKMRNADETKLTFLSALQGQMTLEEKIGQLTLFTSDMDKTGPTINENYKKDIVAGRVGAIFNAYTPAFTHTLQDLALQSRLKIPLLLGYDVIHGHRTIFPIPLAESSTWNMELMEATARASAQEASADGLHWTFSPMVDISRDPRWGRIAEGSGEDPFLGSLIAKAKVRGYQGNNLSRPSSILACVKHFALYGAAEAGRDYNTVDMSRRSMFETYLPPYRAAVEAGAKTLMTSFNDVEGVPSTANDWLTHLLREVWGFDGFIVTDFTGINELVNHGVAANEKEAALLAFKAGIDMDMQGSVYYKNLQHLVEEKEINEAEIDKGVRKILEAKYDLGLFQDPYRQVTEERAKKVLMSPAMLALSKKVATKSVVLLKNLNQTLPLKKGTKVALVGPFADNKRDTIGNWSAAGDWKKSTSVLEGLTKKTSLAIQYEKGANIVDDPILLKKLNTQGALIEIDKRSPRKMISDALVLAKKSDVIVAVMGESQAMSGEAASRAHIGIPDNQVTLLKALKKTGKPIILVLMNGRPLTLTWEDQNMDAILETWFLGTEAGNAIADILVGEANPSGKLTITFPRSVGQIPIYYASKNTGRPYDPNNRYTSKYIDEENTPLYPFGYGLSYSEFSFGDMALNKTFLTKTEDLTLSVPVTNQGPFDGEETVQLYVRDMVASVTRPVKELKSFKKVFLKAGETKRVTFTISEKDLRFYNKRMEYVSEPGEFMAYIGPNSRDLKGVRFDLKN